MLTLIVVSLFVVAISAQRDHRSIGLTRAFLEDGKPRQIENRWEKVGKPNPETPLEFDLVLKTPNAQELENLFWAVSDPNSDQYGQHLSLEEIAERFSPSRETIASVKSWLTANGAEVTSIAATGDFVSFTAPAAAAEKIFSTEFFAFVHPEGAVLTRALAPYSVPIELAKHIAYVSNVHGLPHVPTKSNSKAFRIETSNDVDERKRVTNALIGPANLRKRYNVTTVGVAKDNLQAVAEFQGQYYSPQDLKAFFAKYVSNSKADTVAKVIGTNNAAAPGVEAELDIQYIMGVAPNVPTWFYGTATFDFWSGLTNWAKQLASEKTVPFVHSISYGDQSAASKPSKSYQEGLNTQFQKLGLRGISIIFASGDSGAGCDFCTFYEPSFPATSPFVTAVGATRFINGKDGAEMAVESFGSGGGFSWDFPTPSYQKAAVEHYLTQNKADLPWWFQYNAKGRATPDVSALGIGFAVIVDGVTNEVGGTSASAPTFSAIVSLLNDELLQHKKPTLGFLNPWIYDAATKGGFFDVTKGNNADGCCFTGFKAAPGYDAATGVGTPQFEVLRKLIKL